MLFGSGKKENSLSRDGISLSFFLDEFTSRCGGIRKIQDMTTAEVCFNFIIPWTKEKKYSYCQLIQEENPDLIRPATVYVSHAWKSLFWEVIDTLLDHFRPNKKKMNDIFIWIDIMSINQHIDLGMNMDWFNNSLYSIIDAIGNTLVILPTWKQSIPLQRTWCLTEIYLSLLTKGKFEIAMKDREKLHFIESLKKDSFNEFLNFFCPSIRLLQSETSNPEDKNLLLQFLECTEGGILECEAIIQDQILTWLSSFVEIFLTEFQDNFSITNSKSSDEDETKQQEDQITLQLFLADLYYYLMNYSQASELYQKLMEFLKKRPSSNASNNEKEVFQLISILRKLAVSYQKQGKYQETDIYYHEALHRYRKYLNNQDNIETFNLLNEIIFFYIEQGDYEEAINGYKENVKIAEKLFGKTHFQTITVMNHLGLLYLEQENYEEAESYFEETYQILLDKPEDYGKDHAITLETMKNLGMSYVGLEKFYDAEQLFVDCFHREELRLRKLIPQTSSSLSSSSSTTQRHRLSDRLNEGKETDQLDSFEERRSITTGGGKRRGSESKFNESKELDEDWKESEGESKDPVNNSKKNNNNNNNNEDHPEILRLSVINILDVLQQLSLIYQEEHRYFEAILVNQDYIRIYRQYHTFLFHDATQELQQPQGKDHHHNDANLIKIHQELGKLYLSQQQFEKSESILKECLTLQKTLQIENFQKQLPNNSRTSRGSSSANEDESLLITYEILSDVLEKQGNYSDCLPVTKEWMNKIKKCKGSKSIDLVIPYERLLSLYQHLDKTEEELALYPEMIDRFKKIFDYEGTPLNSPRTETSTTTTNTSNTTATTSGPPNVATLHRQRLQKQKEDPPLPDIDNETRYYLKKLNTLMKSYAVLLSSDRQQKYELAEGYYKECFQLEKNYLYGSDHLETMETLYQLAYLTALQGRYREGEIIIKKCLEKSLKLFGEQNEFTLKLKKTMNEFHEFRESEDKRNGKCIIS